jgi:hypothetical protein
MEFYSGRKIMFKAWNIETGLMMRLHEIPCIKGELVMKNHILLQSTDITDKHNELLYEMDVVLMASERYVILWKSPSWCFHRVGDEGQQALLTPEVAKNMIRLCSFFESETTA